ncbi:MAG: fatty acid desaturase, partial [Pirellula sp.]
MRGEGTIAFRSGKQLHEATRAFANESRAKSWWYTGSTFVLLAILLTIASCVPWWPARVAFAILGGLLLVRAFVLYHDFMHGAILRNSRVGKVLFYLFGLVVLTPPKSWRFSHNFHHANVGRPIPVMQGKLTLLTSDIGAVPLMTTDMWRQASFWQRLAYRISRHPVTILAAYVTVFFLGICLVPLL